MKLGGYAIRGISVNGEKNRLSIVLVRLSDDGLDGGMSGKMIMYKIDGSGGFEEINPSIFRHIETTPQDVSLMLRMTAIFYFLKHCKVIKNDNSAIQ